ncbi:tyrosine-type recombinase/integrase [Lactobacillus sp. Sy-1]|uniref:tyrosine-type recombinase/integrase n=1 Tax=Lactobacillus sp. Sy-1 TaxID=2109645 RepID=UPI001C5A893C|nr:tyrosine-type recombinase/integrase [Lactobacillus sp. Sy-1]MBW1606456.1 tyrosine-type recombinase/integrase [Lactobacillus sp. Sy-1]
MNLNHQDQDVRPIKDIDTLEQVEDTLLNNFKYGVRNLTIFQVGKATLLRVSDVLNLKYDDVFDEGDEVKRSAYIRDKKTKKTHRIYLNPVADDLYKYQRWLKKKDVRSRWLFPNSRDMNKPMATTQYYQIMMKVGDLLGISYLGTHTMRKTGAYMVYKQSNFNLALVMKLLNHSSAAMTLHYLGLEEASMESALDKIEFH